MWYTSDGAAKTTSTLGDRRGACADQSRRRTGPASPSLRLELPTLRRSIRMLSRRIRPASTAAATAVIARGRIAGATAVAIGSSAHAVGEVPTVVAKRAAANLGSLMLHFDAFIEPLETTPSGMVAALSSRLDAQMLLIDRSKRSSPVDQEDPAFATYLWSLARGLQAWAVPSAGGVCLELTTRTGDRLTHECASVSTAESGQMIVSFTEPHARLVAGFVPDVNRLVELQVRDHRPIRIVVHNNAWFYAGALGASSIMLRTADGHTRAAATVSQGSCHTNPGTLRPPAF